ncbi:MAG TPA: Tad domain-containing protein, partial [Acidimicrobiia bacterium]|nr:Tad domain-containing protein [Acidimicrobiia bacterium]
MRSDKGFAALYVAMILFFLMGAAALAVDASGFYQTARADQTTADLACLAGISELPEDLAGARAAAAENARANFPALAGSTTVSVGNITTLTDGNGNTVTIEAPHGGDSRKMRVKVTETDPASFGRALGVESVPITQEAFCKVFAGNGGDVPFGALPGGWTGGLQAENPCGETTGNCGRLYVPRADTTGNSSTTIKNIAEGLDRTLNPALD